MNPAGPPNASIGPLVWTDVALHPDARARLDTSARLTDDYAQAEAAIVGSLFVGDAAAFRRASQLQMLARVGMGYDRVDVAAATVAGVVTTHTPDAPTESTAEFAITLMLASARRLPTALAGMHAGRWEQGADLIGTDLAGRTLGLVGCGRIGQRVAEIAVALRMTVIGFDPGRPELPAPLLRADSLAQLLGTADIVSIHVPLTPATRRLLGPNEFALMRPGALLVNTARGPIVDEAALLAALDSGHLGGAALDVWDPEPPAADAPLRRHPRVMATPHIAALTHDGKRRSHLTAVEQVLAVWRGARPAGLLDPTVWSRRRLRKGMNIEPLSGP